MLKKILSTDIIKIISKYSVYVKNLDFDIPFYEKYIDKLNWSNLSANTNIPIEFYKKHLDKVNWSGLSANTNIPLYYNKQKLIEILKDIL